MSIIGSNILAGASGQGGGYTIERSLRLRSSASAYLNRTFGSGSRTTWTLSMWLKRGAFSASNSSDLFTINNGTTDATYFVIAIRETDKLRIEGYNTIFRETTQVLRDVSAWYHLVVTADTTNGTDGNRIKMYLNGAEITAFSTSNNPTPSQSLGVNQAATHKLGSLTSTYFDGYLTEVNFIDGQALTPSDFGNYNEDTGVWQPVKYTGSYGTNGFYLPFSDNTNTTTLVADSSGNGNDWTPNNISLTSGVTYDSMTDTPTPYAGGGNYCVWNAVAQSTVVNGTVTRSNANLTSTDGGTTYGLASFGTIAVTTGKWYWEVTLTTASDIYANIGVVDLNSALSAGTHTGICYRQSNGYKDSGSNVFAGGGAGTSYGATYAAGDVIGVALDLTAGTITFYKNGTSQGVAYTSISGNYTPAVGDGQNTVSYTFNLNCGQRPFAYTPPTGFLPLHTGNLPDSEIVDGSEYFNTVLYTGNTSGASVTGVGFQPDFVWVKNRGVASNHELIDAVRGGSSALFSNLTNPQATQERISSFDSDGWTYTTNSNSALANPYVGWTWKANGAGVSNDEGSITSTVSANLTSGFSIVTYTGTGVAATVGHGLGVAPSMVIVKNRTTGYSYGWNIYHASLGATKIISFDVNQASLLSSAWNDTSPTSSVFSLGTIVSSNRSGNDYVAYCFAEVPSFSKMGSYVGNGLPDGPFVYTGFRPALVIIKRHDTSGYNWNIYDSARDAYNPQSYELFANTNDQDLGSDVDTDFLSNGFKLRRAGGGINASGGTYIYMAFAENPFKNSLAR